MSDAMIDRRVFYAGDKILQEGTSGLEMFIIESGKVEITKGEDDKKEILGTLSDGAVFGEMALIDDKPRMATATAVQETVCKVIDKKTFAQNMKTLDPFMRRVVDILTKNVRSLSRELDSMI